MFLERYEVAISSNHTVYKFVSQGAKGNIDKVVRYDETNLKDFYNLGFGDLSPETGDVDDIVVTDNGDGQKVLATVAATLYAFTFSHPDCWVFAKGSTPARTRLYRMGITKYWDSIKKDFIVKGLIDGKWKTYRKNQNYEAFIVKRK